MQPNYPTNNQQPSDPFAFINNTSVYKKPSPINPGSMKGRIILVSSGLIILIIVFAIIMSVLGSASKSKAKPYLELGQAQTEIIRLSTIGQQKSKSLDTRSYALTIKLSMTSSQSDVNKVIRSHGISEKELSTSLTQSKNAKSDTLLDEAEKNNRFDSTFNELITTSINNYKKQLNAVAGGASSNEKQILQKAYNQANTLVKPGAS